MPETIDLGGTWKFRLDPKLLGEKYRDQLNYTHADQARWMSVDYDDSAWEKIPVPACWQTQGYGYNGVAWYRTSFPAPELGGEKQAWLEFEGVDYFSDIWLNGRYLGSHEGYFGAFGFDVTPHLKDHNLLAVRVDSPIDAPGEEHELGQLKTTLKGALARWDMNNPEVNPGGIWGDVRLVVTGAVRIVRTRVTAYPQTLPPLGEPDAEVEAIVAVELDLHSSAPTPLLGCELHTAITSHAAETGIATEARTIDVMPGMQTVSLAIRLPAARLWWTWDLGEPCLYEVEASIEITGAVSDGASRSFGIRRIERGEGSSVFLNGVRFFQRGANYLSDQLLSTMTPERYEQDVKLLVGANLNTVHTFCVIEQSSFYDCCDAAGLLVYQDFPMWLTMSDSSDLVRRATTQLEELIGQFGHHPSIGIWNFGSQPSIANFEKLCSALVQTARERDPGRISQHANATFAYTTEPVHSRNSFFWPLEDGTRLARESDWRWDVHLYAGWYFGEVSALRDLPAEHIELVTEFGAQALPARETLLGFIPSAGEWPPDRELYARHCLQWNELLRRVDLGNELDDFIARSQEYQSSLVRYHVEFYRRHKFRPCNGAHLFCFNDCWPAVTWSVVDYNRIPKAAYYALQKAMAPLHILADIDAVDFEPDRPAQLQLWVVNDRPRPVSEAWVEYTITHDEGSVAATGSMPIEVSAGGIADMVTVAWCPANVGRHVLALSLKDRERTVAENEYAIEVRPGAD